MNKAILIGNLTRDPELRTTPNGINVASFSIAVSRRRANAKKEGFSALSDCHKRPRSTTFFESLAPDVARRFSLPFLSTPLDAQWI